MPLHRCPYSLLEQARLQLTKSFLNVITDDSCGERGEALNHYLSILPPLVVEQVLRTSIEFYVKITKIRSAEKGVTVLDLVQYGDIEHSPRIPRLGSLLNCMVSSSTTILDLTYLVHLGYCG